MFDVITLGEILVDFTSLPCFAQNLQFEANPGGAPCNVAVYLAKQGRKAAFLGKVGKDAFGTYLTRTLAEYGVALCGIAPDACHPTTLAFVHLDSAGERSFSFYRAHCADSNLTPEELPDDLLRNCRIFHCGTLSMTAEPARSATLKALSLCKQAHVTISVDPNLRLSLWPNATVAQEAMWKVLKYADIIKISDYEVEFLFGKGTSPQEGARRLLQQVDASAVFITCGLNGAFLFTKTFSCWHPCYQDVPTVDTTGAGDAFIAACLDVILAQGLPVCGTDALFLMQRASAVAALVTTQKGGLRSMPFAHEADALVQKNPQVKFHPTLEIL